MTGWVGDLEAITLDNTTFRTLLFTGRPPAVDGDVSPAQRGDRSRDARSPRPVHPRQDGTATVTLGPSATETETTHTVADDWPVIIPGGTWHNVINSSTQPLGLYSVYAPAEHEPGAVHLTKADADAAEKTLIPGGRSRRLKAQ